MLKILLTVVFIILIYLYVRWTQLKQYWAKRNVAHLPPHPLLGSLNFMLKENISFWLRQMYDTFKKPYVGIWLFWRPGILIHSPEIAKNILVKDQANFRNRFACSGSTDPVGSLNIFTLDDPLWTVLRRRLSPLFTGSKLRGVQQLLTKKSKELIVRIENERQKHEAIDLRGLLTDYTTDIVGTSSFGLMTDTTLTGKSVLRDVTEIFMKFNLFRGLAWCSAFFIPELVDFFRFKMFPTEGVNITRKILREIIKQRGGLENKVVEPRDFLDILIKIKQESGAELDMTEDMMLAQASVFIQGGFDTSSTALTFAIYELAFCPEAQEKLYQELLQAKTKYGDELLDASILSQLTYLNCVLNEGLRKYPILTWLDRVALADYRIDDHLTIKAGTPVYINSVGMHYDPEFYPEPTKFNPDRFLSENVNPYAYLPFGEGPRKCIGQRFGLTTIRHGLAAIMLQYEVKPLPDAPKPSDVKLEKIGLLLSPSEIVSVEFVPRK